MIIYHSNIMKYEAWIFSATPEDTTGDVANENPEECADSAGEHNHLYILCLSVCLLLLLLLLYPINVKTAIPIGTKFCVGPNMAPLENPQSFVCFCFTIYSKRK